MSAGMAATVPPPVMYPAADATDCMALFSSGPNGAIRGATLRIVDQAPKARIAAVMVTPRLQPVLSET